MQSTGVYRIGERDEKQDDKPRRRRRRIIWLIILLLILLLGIWGFFFIRGKLKPDTVIKQSKAVVTKAVADAATKTYNEPDFSIALPVAWQPAARPAGTPYQSYTWQTSQNGSAGEQITVYEDSIPANFAVNRVLIIHAEGDQIALDGVASDSCDQYTISGATRIGEFGAPAKWQGVNFICDQSNTARDIIGTSSLDGANTLTMKSTNTTATHHFFFTLDNQNYGNPDYSVLYNAINSFRLQ